ncbi:MAG: hypothetical protein K0R46_3364 [Herbinix sp.]|nr:hypothetical protein [Herbinix sp.]
MIKLKRISEVCLLYLVFFYGLIFTVIIETCVQSSSSLSESGSLLKGLNVCICILLFILFFIAGVVKKEKQTIKEILIEYIVMFSFLIWSIIKNNQLIDIFILKQDVHSIDVLFLLPLILTCVLVFCLHTFNVIYVEILEYKERNEGEQKYHNLKVLIPLGNYSKIRIWKGVIIWNHK